MTVAVALSGALGRMGREIEAALAAEPRARLVSRVDATVGDGLVSLPEALDLTEVVIDVSSPDATATLVKAAAEHGDVAVVTGTTGLSDAQRREVRRAAERIAILQSDNFSLGLNLLLGLARQAARALPARDWDIEISESHHRRKVDAPSGTALMLGRGIAQARGVELDDVAEIGRVGAGPRHEGSIGFSVLRGGGIVGEHTVLFAAEDELITFVHSARNRSLFARGAVRAALWIKGRPPGLYDMQDVLGLKAP